MRHSQRCSYKVGISLALLIFSLFLADISRGIGMRWALTQQKPFCGTMTGASPGWELAAGVMSEKKKIAKSQKPPEVEVPQMFVVCGCWHSGAAATSPGEHCCGFCVLQKGEGSLTPQLTGGEVPCAGSSVWKSDLLIWLNFPSGRKINKKKTKSLLLDPPYKRSSADSTLVCDSVGNTVDFGLEVG